MKLYLRCRSCEGVTGNRRGKWFLFETIVGEVSREKRWRGALSIGAFSVEVAGVALRSRHQHPLSVWVYMLSVFLNDLMNNAARNNIICRSKITFTPSNGKGAEFDVTS